MKWHHFLFIILTVTLATVVVYMNVKADIEIWKSDFPFWLKWKLFLSGGR
jgi:cytochrome bd-type quinol oxidase subunit 1